MQEQSIILQTKVTVPPLRHGLVERARLLETITPLPHQTLTILAAPAGLEKPHC